MLTEICQYLKNWFNRKPNGTEYPKEAGVFTIEDGVLHTDILAEGQYFRVLGSLFNDGVHKFGDADLTDETFDGEIWSMGIPPDMIKLAEDISTWMEKYGSVDSAAMSPYQSESFDGYSYTKQQASSGSVGGSGGSASWNTVFSSRLAPWRKI